MTSDEYWYGIPITTTTTPIAPLSLDVTSTKDIQEYALLVPPNSVDLHELIALFHEHAEWATTSIEGFIIILTQLESVIQQFQNQLNVLTERVNLCQSILEDS